MAKPLLFPSALPALRPRPRHRGGCWPPQLRFCTAALWKVSTAAGPQRRPCLKRQRWRDAAAMLTSNRRCTLRDGDQAWGGALEAANREARTSPVLPPLPPPNPELPASGRRPGSLPPRDKSSQEDVLTCARNLTPFHLAYEAVFVGLLRVMKDSEMQNPQIFAKPRGILEIISSGVIQVEFVV